MNCSCDSDDDVETDIGRTSAVGIFPHGTTPTPEQVYDLSGNVWECCLDAVYNTVENRLSSEVSRAMRGGAWNLSPDYCRAAYRLDCAPDARYFYLGFRVCRGSPIDPWDAGPAER